MIVSRALADQRIVLMACLHCLQNGNSLIPDGGFTTWCVAHWDQLLTDTKQRILKHAIMTITAAVSPVDDLEVFVSWGLGHMDPHDRTDLYQQLARSEDDRATMTRLLTNCGRCGFEHHVCLCDRGIR